MRYGWRPGDEDISYVRSIVEWAQSAVWQYPQVRDWKRGERNGGICLVRFWLESWYHVGLPEIFPPFFVGVHGRDSLRIPIRTSCLASLRRVSPTAGSSSPTSLSRLAADPLKSSATTKVGRCCRLAIVCLFALLLFIYF